MESPAPHYPRRPPSLEEKEGIRLQEPPPPDFIKKRPKKSRLKPLIGKLLKKPLWWHIATWFGVGYARVASGTMGSLAALPFAYLIQITLGNFGLLVASAALFVAGVWAADKFIRAEPEHGSDPKPIVADEVAGQWLILSVLYPTWQSYLVGFLLFRLFDIVKPWPVSWADQKLKGGLGVMFDDFLAAMYPVITYLIIILETRAFGAPQLVKPIVAFLADIHVP